MKKVGKKLLTVVSMITLMASSSLISAANWQQDANGWWYSNDSPIGYARDWAEIDGKWYLFGQDGYMKTGWQQDGSFWYYFDEENGAMAHDEWIGDYYVLSSGVMAVDQWIGDYYVGSDGVWIPNYGVEATTYPEGTYAVGTDIPAGEYVLFNTSDYSAYFEYNSDGSWGFDGIISNDNFIYNSIIEVQDGNYLTLQRCYAVPLSSATVEADKEGMFKVGTHLDAGTYTIETNTKSPAFVAVFSDASQAFASMVSSETFSTSTSVTVSDGQYLLIKYGHIKNQ